MATITLAECERQIGLWTECLAELAEGKTYQIGDRIISLENADIAQRTLDMWIRRKNHLVRRSKNRKGFRGIAGRATF